jgi:holo-[acyl-carrier protein] synthase
VLVGIGIDLVEIPRVASMLERWGDRLVEKIMDPEEAGRLPLSPEARVRAVACAITLKESASKALGTGWSHGIFWRDVVAFWDGEPHVTLRAEALALAQRLGCTGHEARLNASGDLVIGEVWLLR